MGPVVPGPLTFKLLTEALAAEVGSPGSHGVRQLDLNAVTVTVTVTVGKAAAMLPRQSRPRLFGASDSESQGPRQDQALRVQCVIQSMPQHHKNCHGDSEA
jgi:hypothetical protein